MIRTFEELFEKLEVDGHDSRRLKDMHASYFYWKKEHEKNLETVSLSILMHKYRENLLGYLSCLQNTGCICQSEYDRLWNSLELPDIPEKGNTHDSNI